MSAFIAAFLVVYTAMHVLVFTRIRSLLPNRQPFQAFCILFFIAMILAPIAARLLERSGHDLSAKLTAWVGYPWMGFIFLSVSAFLFLGIYDLIAALVRLIAGVSIPSSAGSTTTGVVIAMVILVCLYGYFDAKRIRTERVTIKTSKLPSGMDRLKIAQISDVHLGLLVGGKRLESILGKVREEKPDLLVSTGDLVDGTINRSVVTEVSGLLSGISTRYGKYAVTGNHEYIAGLTQSLELIRQFGFKLLRQEAVTVDNVLTIVGIDDPMEGSTTDETALLSSLESDRFILFLKHRPDVHEGSRGLFDLQLSGHTHRGQIFPFSLITGRVYPMQDGFYDLEKGSKLHTSRGSGTWGPPMRVLSPPEVTIIELVRDTGSEIKR